MRRDEITARYVGHGGLFGEVGVTPEIRQHLNRSERVAALC